MNIRRNALLKLSVISFSAACLALGASGANAQNQDATQKLMKSAVLLAANNARVASEVCGVDASTVSGYKNSASKKFSQDPSFAADWDTGWKNAAKTVASFQQMKTSSPKDYDEQKSATCSDLQEQMKM
ncbi:hypothetical protein [Paraburkholderia susongensis]|uniref:Uncharacterized protein n=1 Tax=Paraburkholderia susongensis TaxID=1515439 RepID=A0A1X7LV78_9BURK|nr:hypothetical protein [Paraburkholderia susongensis]SMG57059.1 hypothetical protein SAMN06265784_10963 [Paraburkholderia susongensis]